MSVQLCKTPPAILKTACQEDNILYPAAAEQDNEAIERWCRGRPGNADGLYHGQNEH